MSEKKTKNETAAKKKAKKKTTGRGKGKKEKNPADVRKAVSTMVQSKAMAMAKAVIGENEKGVVPKDLQLATVKYLFEMASIYPPQADQDQATADEDCLAKTLLNRLNIPDKPVRQDDDEEEEETSIVSVEKDDTKLPEVIAPEPKNAEAPPTSQGSNEGSSGEADG